MDIEEHHRACRDYWRGRLSAAASISVPEERIDEMIRAGFLHLDVHTYGLEPDSALSAEIGLHYSPIGSESAPIIQFFDSMGCHDMAVRSLQFFLDRQRDDGFIQVFYGDYMIETGAVLWSMGEHYRYTKDRAWLEGVLPKLLKSCDYLIAWRRRNMTDELRGSGYGMIEGKCGDPEDPYHSFTLNGYAYMGLARTAEMLQDIGHDRGAKLAAEAAAYREDIRQGLRDAMARSQVIPPADGTWCPSCPLSAEPVHGPMALHADDTVCWTHGCIACRDSLAGPLYLAFQGLLDPCAQETDFLLHGHQELFTIHNTALSQPYYSRHAWVHLARGEVVPFLKTYYNTMTSLADPETYTFWEYHMFAAPHKTHEEAWFLMQTRWMLYRECGDSLHLMGGIPRAWLTDGKRIELNSVATYFGPMSCTVTSEVSLGRIAATVECQDDRRPARLSIRLPHPEGLRAKHVNGGAYDADTETVVVSEFDGYASVELVF